VAPDAGGKPDRDSWFPRVNRICSLNEQITMANAVIQEEALET